MAAPAPRPIFPEGSMGVELLAELKRRLVQEKQLPPVWNWFLDNFAENEEFMALGEPVDHEFLGAVVAQIAAQLYGPREPVHGLRLIRLGEHSFVHGGVFVGGRP